MRPSIVSRLAGAIFSFWLFSTGAAWAGGGGADLGTLQALLGDPNNPSTGLCGMFKISPCPIPPTVTQSALEVAALGNSLFEMLLQQNNIVPSGSRVYASNPSVVPPAPGVPGCLAALPISSTTTPTVQDCLSTLTPLAFVSQNPGTATAKATQLSNSSADTFFYAVALSSGDSSGAFLPVPDKVYFFYEAFFRTNPNGTIAAKFSLPLAVLNNDGTEREVPTTLNFTGTAATTGGGNCTMSTVTGDFKGTGRAQTLTGPGQIGVDCAVVFSATPASAQTHAIFEVAVPLLVTTACSATACPDPLYFYSFNNSGVANPVNSPVPGQGGPGVYTAFGLNGEVGFPAGSILGAAGVKIGLPPRAGSLPPPSGAQFGLALCASLPVNTNGNGAQLRPAVGAFYAMATSGEMLLAAPTPSAFALGGAPPVCP